MVLNSSLAVLFVIVLLAEIITVAVTLLFKKKRIYRYIPAILTAAGSIAFYIKILYSSRSFEDIGLLILSIALAIFSVASLLTAIITNLIIKRIPKK